MTASRVGASDVNSNMLESEFLFMVRPRLMLWRCEKVLMPIVVEVSAVVVNCASDPSDTHATHEMIEVVAERSQVRERLSCLSICPCESVNRLAAGFCPPRQHGPAHLDQPTALFGSPG